MIQLQFLFVKNFSNSLSVTLILPAMILKIASLHDLSLRATRASHWLLSPERQIVEGDNF